MSSPFLSAVRGFGLGWCCSSHSGVTRGPLVILTRPQSSKGDMNHPVVGEVSRCSLCALTKPCNPGIFFRLRLHMGKGISTRPRTHNKPCDDGVFSDVYCLMTISKCQPHCQSSHNDIRKEFFLLLEIIYWWMRCCCLILDWEESVMFRRSCLLAWFAF